MEPQQIKRLAIITIVTLFLAGIILLIMQCVLLSLENDRLKKEINSQELGNKSLDFTQLFVQDFLLSSKTVGFEERLKLENSVRDIQDQEIFSKWQEFTNSGDNGQAQKSAGELLNLLLSRIRKGD